ncbi:MAG TPA: dihydrolipoyllysine-residue acetyltransferase [Terriglobia bacterium]|nr:dihydrolipoyllysine-residue acetyltransferase [Terriglobia bacterium]
MSTEFRLPELGENIDKGDLIKVLVSPGEMITKDQPVIELETDKATLEVPSSVGGKVEAIHVKAGEKVKVGQVILTVSDGAQPSDSQATQAKETSEVGQKVDGAGTRARQGLRTAEDTRQKSAAGLTESGERASAKQAASEAAVEEEPEAGGGIVEVRLPELGENIEKGDLLKVLVAPGDNIAKDQPVIELETDKATLEVPSSVGGTVKEIHVKAGEKIKVGQLILTLQSTATSSAKKMPARKEAKATGTEDVKALATAVLAKLDAAQSTAAQRLPAFKAPQASAPKAEVSPASEVRAAVKPVEKRLVPAAPSIRRMARELGVDITQVKGSGPAGRISAEDIKAYVRGLSTGRAASGVPQEAIPLPDFTRWGPVEREPMRAVRRATAAHLSHAWVTVPRVTQHDKADITELEEFRKQYSKKAAAQGAKPTVTAFALKVVASALRKFPKFAASIDPANEEIIYKKYSHVGVAVDTDRGLLVPVIRDVDRKNIVELSIELAAAAEKARTRKLAPEEMEGGVFTITNLGGIGGTSFTPIVNWPEVAILGMSRSSLEPVLVDGEFQPRLMLPLSLSYDHRLIDGADAARFLRWVAEAMEQPFLMPFEG